MHIHFRLLGPKLNFTQVPLQSFSQPLHVCDSNHVHTHQAELAVVMVADGHVCPNHKNNKKKTKKKTAKKKNMGVLQGERTVFSAHSGIEASPCPTLSLFAQQDIAGIQLLEVTSS